MTRKKWMVIFLIFSPAIMAYGLWFAVEFIIHKKLREAGWNWESSERNLMEFTWHGLKRNSISIDVAELALIDKTAELTGVHIKANLSDAQESTATNMSWPEGLVVNVNDLSLSFGDFKTIDGLKGTLIPHLYLESDAFRVQKSINGWRIEGRHDFKYEHLEGQLEFKIRPHLDSIQMKATSNNLKVDWSLLSPETIKPSKVELTAYRKNGKIEGELSIDSGPPVTFESNWEPDASEWVLKAMVEDYPYSLIIQHLNIKEKDRLTVSGSLTSSLTLKGPELNWQTKWSTTPIETMGDLIEPLSLSKGKTTYSPLNSDKPREIGPLSPNWVHLKEMGFVPNAVIAAEDGHFWSHPGYNLNSIREAIRKHLKDGKPLRGGSSITQQLAKNLYLSGDRSLSRKLRELLYALELERLLGKKQILAIYLNAIEYGPDIYGVHDAADAYFVKSPKSLTPKEAAYLASILPAPKTHFKRAQKSGRIGLRRVNGILKVMRQRGFLSAEEYQEALKSKLIVVPPQ